MSKILVDLDEKLQKAAEIANNDSKFGVVHRAKAAVKVAETQQEIIDIEKFDGDSPAACNINHP